MSADGGMPELSPPWPQRLARIERVLGASGRRLVKSSAGWVVIVGADRRRRPLLRLAEEEAARLIAEERVAPAKRGGGYVSRSPPTTTFEDGTELADAETESAAGPWLFAIAGVRRPRKKKRGFAALALAAFAGDGPLSMRQAAAGLRLVEDAERAARDPALTMNWDAGPADKQRRSAGAPAGPRTALAAARRLRRIRAIFGKSEPGFQLLWSACIRQLPLCALHRRFGIRRDAVTKTLSEALEKLADTYDG